MVGCKVCNCDYRFATYIHRAKLHVITYVYRQLKTVQYNEIIIFLAVAYGLSERFDTLNSQNSYGSQNKNYHENLKSRGDMEYLNHEAIKFIMLSTIALRCNNSYEISICICIAYIPIFRSSLPGRSRAGSRVSGRFVAMINLTFPKVSNPSI